MTAVLFEAVTSGKLGEVKEALRAMTIEDLNTRRPPFDWTCLHVASHGGHTSVVSLLLRYGASPHIKDKAGWYAVDYALKHGHLDVVKLLQAQSDEADDGDNKINDDRAAAAAAAAADKEGELNLEANEEEDAVVDELKPKVKKKSHFLLPPVLREPPDPGSKMKCVEVLLLRGADPDNVDMFGRTALEYASLLLGKLPEELSHISALFSASSHGVVVRHHRQGSSNRREHSLPHEPLGSPPGTKISTVSWSDEEPVSPLSSDVEKQSDSTMIREMPMTRRQEAQRRRTAEGNHEREATELAAEKERQRREHSDREELKGLALFSAAAAGDDSRLSRLLRKYQDSILMAPFQAEQTLLHVAAFHGRYSTCELLIDAGADVSPPPKA